MKPFDNKKFAAQLKEQTKYIQDLVNACMLKILSEQATLVTGMDWTWTKVCRNCLAKEIK